MQASQSYIVRVCLKKKYTEHVYVILNMVTVLGRVTIAMVKHHDQKQLGEERVYLTYTFTS